MWGEYDGRYWMFIQKDMACRIWRVFLYCVCGWIFLPAVSCTTSEEKLSEKSNITQESSKKPDAMAYVQYLETLDINEKESILKARDTFLKLFSDAPDSVSAEAFRLFRKFYTETVRRSSTNYFQEYPIDRLNNRYRKDYQDLLNEILPVRKMAWKTAMQLDPLAYFETQADEFKSKIEEKYGDTLKELYEFKKCGMRFYYCELHWWADEDPKFLETVSSVLKSDYQEFVLFYAGETKQWGCDAALIISWDELRQRIIRRDNFARSHPDLPETESEIKPQLHRMVQVYLTGIDNTRAYDYGGGYGGTAKIDPELRKSYEIFIKENTGSSYYPLIHGIYNILKKHDFKCERELGYFLINNGFQVYYWRECLKNK